MQFKIEGRVDKDAAVMPVTDASHGGVRAEAGRRTMEPDSKGGKEGEDLSSMLTCVSL